MDLESFHFNDDNMVHGYDTSGFESSSSCNNLLLHFVQGLLDSDGPSIVEQQPTDVNKGPW